MAGLWGGFFSLLSLFQPSLQLETQDSRTQILSHRITAVSNVLSGQNFLFACFSRHLGLGIFE